MPRPVALVESYAQLTVVCEIMPYGVWSRVGDGELEKNTLAEMLEVTVSAKPVRYAVTVVRALTLLVRSRQKMRRTDSSRVRPSGSR